MKRTVIILSAALAALSANATVSGSANDFISAEWKAAYGSRWCDASNRTVSAALDADGDGAGILDEYRAGTSPAVGGVPAADGSGWLDERPSPYIVVDLSHTENASVSALHFDLASKSSGKIVARYDVRDGTSRSVKIPVDAPGRRTVTRLIGPVRPGTVTATTAIGESSSVITDRVTTWPKGELRTAAATPAGSIDYLDGRVTIDLSRVKSVRSARVLTLSWTESFRGLAENGLGRAYLTVPYEGHAAPGEYYLIAYADNGCKKEWIAGAPYGVGEVTLGFESGFTEITLSDVHPSVMRMDMAKAVANNTFAAQSTVNDRGVKNSMSIGSNRAIPDVSLAKTLPSANETETRVRIVRTGVNEIGAYTRVYSDEKHISYIGGAVLDTKLDLTINPYLTEYQVLRDGQLDLDWGNVISIGNKVSVSSVTSVLYRVVIGDGSINPKDGAVTNENNLATMFVNRFENKTLGLQTACTPVSPAGTIYSARPTFRWTHKNTIDKDYPAFRLRVWQSSALIYDTGARRAPSRDADGVYAFTPDDLFNSGITPSGKLFSGAYTWSVSMLDAKFTTPNTTETKMSFIVSQSSQADLGDVTVYVGGYSGSVSPAAFSAGTTNRIVRIEAANVPDFSQVFKASYLASVSGITSDVSTSSPSASLIALDTDRPVYIRAFIDTNGDGKLTSGEPYGYTCGSDDLPAPVTPVAGSTLSAYIHLYDPVP